VTTNNHAKLVCIIDSDIAIDYLRLNDYAVKLFEEWAQNGPLAISSLTHYEVYRGMRGGEEESTDNFLDSLVTIDVTIEIARNAGKLMNGLRTKGITIDTTDAVIAATAIKLNIPLITNNVSHYPFAGLKLLRGKDWRGGFLVRERRHRYSARKS
jgi:predicted nucleic acid-binding protein